MFRRTPVLKMSYDSPYPWYKFRTSYGMNRMLKRPIPFFEHIRLAVESGVYRTPNEIQAMVRQRQLQDDPIQSVMQRFRQDIVRGAYVHDYPPEYLIFRAHPPLPDIPKISTKQRRQLAREAAEQGKLATSQVLKRLTERYLQRLDDDRRTAWSHAPPANADGSPLTADEFYERLSADPNPTRRRRVHGLHSGNRHLDKLAAPLQKAYAAAVKHHQLVRQQGMSDEEAMETVDGLLQQQAVDEYQQAATVVAQAQKLRRQKAAAAQAAQDEAAAVQAQKRDPAFALAPALDKPVAAAAETTTNMTIGPRTTMWELGKAMGEATTEGQRANKNAWRDLLRGGRKDWVELAQEERREQQARHEQHPEQHPAPPPVSPLEHVFETVLGSEPRVLEAMMRWSKRLLAVPYAQWTVGASTALDHWIARQVLHYSEETWQSMLEGDDPAYLARGKLVVLAREALFPETISHQEDEDDVEEEPVGHAKTLDEDSAPQAATADNKPRDDFFASTSTTDATATPQPSLQDLLASLDALTQTGRKQREEQGLAGPTTTTSRSPEPPLSLLGKDDKTTTTSLSTTQTLATLNERVAQIVDEMQDWRRVAAEKGAFDTWSEAQQAEMNEWIRHRFIPTCASSTELERQGPVDINATRQAILASPPVSKQDSDAFWSALSNEQDATELLERMQQDGPPPGATVLQSSFWDLEYAQQLEQLLNLGAIRPLLDEYTKETDRLAFLQKHGETLLTGVPLECLVPDEDGPISVEDIRAANAAMVQELGLGEHALGTMAAGALQTLPAHVQQQLGQKQGPKRFRIQKLPYRGGGAAAVAGGNTGSYDDYEHARTMFRLWNRHKAHRARYEEELFRTERMGLTYDKTPKQPDEYGYFDYFPEQRLPGELDEVESRRQRREQRQRNKARKQAQFSRFRRGGK